MSHFVGRNTATLLPFKKFLKALPIRSFNSKSNLLQGFKLLIKEITNLTHLRKIFLRNVKAAESLSLLRYEYVKVKNQTYTRQLILG